MNLNEKRELLEEYAEQYLFALLHSQPICKDENSSVYINQGMLMGVCRVFNITFDVELRRKVTFYKSNGKVWFEVINNTFTEEESREMIQRRLHEWDEANKQMKNF